MPKTTMGLMGCHVSNEITKKNKQGFFSYNNKGGSGGRSPLERLKASNL